MYGIRMVGTIFFLFFENKFIFGMVRIAKKSSEVTLHWIFYDYLDTGYGHRKGAQRLLIAKSVLADFLRIIIAGTNNPAIPFYNLFKIIMKKYHGRLFSTDLGVSIHFFALHQSLQS